MTMTTDSHSEKILPFDLFVGYAYGQRHYYVCIYSQDVDENNPLSNDVFGVLVTTNQKYKKMFYNDYNVPITINGRQGYACCDKMLRFKKEDIDKKPYGIPRAVARQIKEKTIDFFTEVMRQMKKETEKW
jgi:hypothetical protein